MQNHTLMHKVRIVTAASLFDGHDAAINIMRRLLQKGGAEIIHLGHNIPALTVVETAIQEDVHAIALSSYQGGHMEYFKYIHDLLVERGSGHIRIFGGGGGVILPKEIEELHAHGIERIYSPEDGQVMGLEGIISDLLKRSDYELPRQKIGDLSFNQQSLIASLLSQLENAPSELRETLLSSLNPKKIPVLGITGTGGSGKSSLTDELILRFLQAFPDIKIGIVCVDPTRKKTGGALLGDRIRMNALNAKNTFMRSMATRDSASALSQSILDVVKVYQCVDFDLILVESSGIGQADTGLMDFCDTVLYVMTPEYGASSQLEKIGMLDTADLIAVNKMEKRGGEDALRDVRKQVARNKDLHHNPELVQVFGTQASQFANPGVTSLFYAIVQDVKKKGYLNKFSLPEQNKNAPAYYNVIVPPQKQNYLSEIAESIRSYHNETKTLADKISRAQKIKAVSEEYPDCGLHNEFEKIQSEIPREAISLLSEYQKLAKDYDPQKRVFNYDVRGKTFSVDLTTETLSGTPLPKVALPSYRDHGDLFSFLRSENLPGFFPYTAGVFPFKRSDEDPKRQFAGEGGPSRTNKRFHYLSRNDESKRLSTAFDSVTLYGEDPQTRPDIYGKIGESGVSICTVRDMEDLFSGFDLIHPNTSVSMTINGPAPIILAMFLNTAIKQEAQKRGVSDFGSEYEAIKTEVLQQVRGTVQADILKEDQAQNTCIFSIDFALKMMGDIQEYFVRQKIKNFYSVSISGYHIAEAGANPITQCALTLSNGFTFVEYYLARGMKIDDFAGNLSFFFSNGMDAEYSVIGRVARRIWAIAMCRRYGANPRSQKLKYHIQTSGRSLHAQEIDFNDIRTTLQALMALGDNCNSLHTNAYDEAITTPTEESVRRAMAIQLIITRELGLARNENSLQGSFAISYLTDWVEEAILKEFDRISSRGGVLGAMETQYQRSRIQEESMLYETRKSSGELPIIGVNTYLPEHKETSEAIAVTRASYAEKDEQISRLKEFQSQNSQHSEKALKRLQSVALSGGNIFEELMETVKVCSLGQISHALYAVGGRYRRAM
ncbi:MAG: cobalamin B12-binding domain-containing protein [Candidatus Cloacimonetes bacterium]|nr:cobalamin B12-binding domain-containing protein [Candidatus Cloacimonadota bacterium]